MKDLLTMLMPVIVGGITTTAMTWLKKGVAVLATLPAILQQVIVATTSWGLMQLSALASVALTSFDIRTLVDVDVASLAAAGFAFAFHLGAQNKAIATKLAKTLPLVAIMFLAACPKASAEPLPYNMTATATQAGDTLRVTAPCQASAPTVACRFDNVVDSIRGVTIVATQTVAVGSSLTFSYVCPAPLARVVITAEAFGLTAGGTSTTTSRKGRGEAVCPDAVPTLPQPFTIIITVTPTQ